MNRAEAIATVESAIDNLSDERLEMLADVVRSWSGNTVFSSLPERERQALDEAFQSLDRGEGVLLDTVDASLEARLKAAGV